MEAESASETLSFFVCLEYQMMDENKKTQHT
jgi:hypothetical protein